MPSETLNLAGFHHLTAVSAQIRENKRFYTQTLGLRLVKRSVNQDDVSAYHLFYADKVGSPGTDITFFDWPIEPERRGNHSVTRTAFRIKNQDSLDYWRGRFEKLGVKHSEPVERGGREYLDFEDQEGQRLSLTVDDRAGDERVAWEDTDVPPEHQLLGLGPITMTVPRLEGTDLMLKSVMNMRSGATYPDPESPESSVHVYEMGGGGLHAELHVAVRPDLAPARLGAGGVHHVAFRTPNSDEYDRWTELLTRTGVRHSGPVDRYYFRSLYFREPGGVLFEIATDGPGFAVDEDPATLGEKVVLPPFLEPRRDEILAGLKPID